MFSKTGLLAAALVLASFFEKTTAFDCASKELSNYQFDLLKGVHAVSVSRDTPPSVSNFTWYIAVCEDLKVDGCPAGSQICGIEEILLPDSKPLRTQIISIPESIHPVSVPYSNFDPGPNNGTGIRMFFKGASWGSKPFTAFVEYTCDESDGKNEFEVSRTDTSVNFTWRTKAACLKGKSDKGKKPSGDKEGGSWGWFTWLFIIIVLAAAVFIIFGAWAQVSTTGEINLNRMVNDFVDNSKGVGKAVPGFVGEVVERLVGSNDRGGYSAV
ncbi:hypothetical protein BABINDRAFT_30494 [Babjeviella inositovora NRRL Y-12698]|uniref:Autophagy-related protein 27 n=1 Tax=Babjeviella inositovora NRRL Y-12698 TaxID=984486 RepID=A0A1E3QY67_9ASCO|nr:uncharacterized protein BABINDRAFT_30494 [Babjeviella inositovora NRRL Y-12698]ODQ82561.1 hypothetical protein BABINDRAFT_30494 [Babjeviella inositovora NRRL Y-12698]